MAKIKLTKVDHKEKSKLKDYEYFEDYEEETKTKILVTNKGYFYTLTGLRGYYAQLNLYGDCKKNKEKKIL